MKVSRIAHEKKTVELMIRLYCRKKEKNTILCADCEELLRYAHARLDHCPFGEKKSACKECTVHCYKPVMRERMRQVMRFSGPRRMHRTLLQTRHARTNATGDAFLRTEDVALCTLAGHTTFIEPITY